MLVTMSSKRAHAFLVTNRNALAGCDFPDATQLQLGKLRFPGIKQRNRVFARDGEKELEILSIRKCGKQWCFGGGFRFGSATRFAADWNRRRMKLRTNAARFQYVAKVTREAIT